METISFAARTAGAAAPFLTDNAQSHRRNSLVHRRNVFRNVIVALAILATALLSAPATASSVAAEDVVYRGIRSQDQIVLVDVRSAGCSTNPERMANHVRYREYKVTDESGARSWETISLEDFVAGSNSSTPTIIYVHGNQISRGADQQRGMSLYRKLVRKSDDDQPIRFVIFSWPSSKIRGPIRDFRVKAVRTRPVGWELAWVVSQLPPDTPVSYIGYSYGARVITGALHVLGGGSLGGPALDTSDRVPARVVLMGAALDACWLCEGRYHGQAMSQVDRMLLLTNCNDPAMRWFRFSTKYGNPQALGLAGPTCHDEGTGRITRMNVSGYVGSTHDEYVYRCAPGVISESWDYLTFQDL